MIGTFALYAVTYALWCAAALLSVFYLTSDEGDRKFIKDLLGAIACINLGSFTASLVMTQTYGPSHPIWLQATTFVLFDVVFHACLLAGIHSRRNRFRLTALP